VQLDAPARWIGHSGAGTRRREKRKTGRFAVAANIRFINPDTLNKPPAYTQVVEVTGPGRTVFISGQLGGGIDGKLVGSDFRSQAVQVFENLKAALAAVGAGFKDVVKVNSYLADVADLPVLREVRMGYLNAAALPASTTLGGLSFAREGALLEVEVVAALPAKAARTAASRTAAKPRAAKRSARKAKARTRGRKGG
jgi:enamine deaminase RidA (YjgF/YER057c/UK114 family)